MIATVKTCSMCKRILSLSSYYKAKKNKDGYFGHCKECQKTKSHDFYIKNKEKRNKQTRVWRKSNPKRLKTIERRATLKKHGVALEEYEFLLKRCGNRCVICNEKETRKNQYGITPLSVDHDHKTGKIRGLLCNRCNRVLGMVKDDLNILTEMKSYLGDKNE